MPQNICIGKMSSGYILNSNCDVRKKKKERVQDLESDSPEF